MWVPAHRHLQRGQSSHTSFYKGAEGIAPQLPTRQNLHPNRQQRCQRGMHSHKQMSCQTATGCIPEPLCKQILTSRPMDGHLFARSLVKHWWTGVRSLLAALKHCLVRSSSASFTAQTRGRSEVIQITLKPRFSCFQILFCNFSNVGFNSCWEVGSNTGTDCFLVINQYTFAISIKEKYSTEIQIYLPDKCESNSCPHHISNSTCKVWSLCQHGNTPGPYWLLCSGF